MMFVVGDTNNVHNGMLFFIGIVALIFISIVDNLVNQLIKFKNYAFEK